MKDRWRLYNVSVLKLTFRIRFIRNIVLIKSVLWGLIFFSVIHKVMLHLACFHNKIWHPQNKLVQYFDKNRYYKLIMHCIGFYWRRITNNFTVNVMKIRGKKECQWSKISKIRTIPQRFQLAHEWLLKNCQNKYFHVV